ncbi:hypothetical protein BGW38_003588 [Lunasporangiospora selenospora]|uniref:Large ribosomal subunit protein mL59 domain-containing protein n=1 Tax=Lunasporangiospora selenospora TaxID=979761 RepID=A0A9P6FQG1_9FUNG|nr:hypothetical protein BGW38_003588 [Lunasporangiospora selenospora]
MASQAAATASRNAAVSIRKLMAHPNALNKSLTGLRVRPTSDYSHKWVPVPGVATPIKASAASSTPTPGAAPSILNENGERIRMRWQQAKVSARTLADIRKKVARLERAGITIASHPETGAPLSGAQFLNLPPPKPVSTKTVRMGKPDKGRKHDRTAPKRKAKVAKAVADMPKTIQAWKQSKAAERVKTKSTLPF